MLKRILIALDGSENAAKALPWLRRTAAREKSEVLLLRVADLEKYGREYVHVELRQAHDYLEGIAAGLQAAGIRCKVMARVGDPAPVIVATAAAQGCNLILMTTRGESKIKRWVLGGVTEKVLRLSAVPVLVIRSGTRLIRGRFRRIIVPVDGSQLAESVIPWAARMATLHQAPIVFLYVYPAGPIGLRTRYQERFERINARMTQVCRDLKKRGVKATFGVQSGDAADRILSVATPNDLVLTTTHGNGGLPRWMFGSVAEKLIHGARGPVLVYK